MTKKDLYYPQNREGKTMEIRDFFPVWEEFSPVQQEKLTGSGLTAHADADGRADTGQKSGQCRAQNCERHTENIDIHIIVPP